MKYIILLSAAIWLFSCNTNHLPARNDAVYKTDSVYVNDSSEEVEDNDIKEDTIIPAGIGIDTIQYMDSQRSLAVNIRCAYPTDGAKDRYRELVLRTIDKGYQAFKQSLEKSGEEHAADPEAAYNPSQHHKFAVMPVNFYQDANMVSIRFCITETTAGGVHAMNYLTSINYDKRTQKELLASDYFNIKTHSDSSLLISLLDKSFRVLREHTTDDPWTFYGLSHIDFYVTRNIITFNFGDYALGQGPSMVDCKIKKPELISLINPGYR